MADFYPVLKRAIASLPSNSGETRRIVYEKARAALLKQLQSYDPPLSPSDITDQRLALEECIRRVESEVAGAAFGLPEREDPAPDAPPPRPAPEPSPPPKAQVPQPKAPVPQPKAPAEPPKPVAPPVRPVDTAKAPMPDDGPVAPPPTIEVRKPVPTAVPRAEPTPEPPRPEPGPDPKIGAGMSALAKTLRSAENLGGASKEAVRKARGAIEDEAPPPRAEPERVEPDFLQRPLGLDRAPEASQPAEPKPQPVSKPEPADKTAPDGASDPKTAPDLTADRPGPAGRRGQGEKGDRANRPRKTGAGQKTRGPARRRSALSAPVIAALILVVALIAAAAIGFVQRDRLMALIDGAPEAPAPTEVAAPAAPTNGGLTPKILDRLPQDGEVASPVAPDALAVQTEPVAPVDGDDIPADPSRPETAFTDPAPADTPIAALEPTPTAEPIAEPTQAPETPVVAEPTPAPETPVVAEPAPTAEPVPPASGEPAVLVAQRAILYEEPIPGSEGARVEGSVLWTLVNEPVLPGEPPQPQARATIEIPDRDVTLTVSFRKNVDAALPASHIVQLTFGIPVDFPGRSIDTTPGLILKETEDARGDPLIGAVAEVADNLFWLALSGAPQEAERNLALMRERPWFDVPIRYGNRRRAILTFEKGTPGEQVFQQAFAAWNAPG